MLDAAHSWISASSVAGRVSAEVDVLAPTTITPSYHADLNGENGSVGFRNPPSDQKMPSPCSTRVVLASPALDLLQEFLLHQSDTLLLVSSV